MYLTALDEVELVAVSNHTSLSAGETVLLACVGFGLPSIEISWIYNSQAITNTSLISIYEVDVEEDGKVFRQSILQICAVEISDSGIYICLVSNGISEVNYTVNVDVSAPQG